MGNHTPDSVSSLNPEVDEMPDDHVVAGAVEEAMAQPPQISPKRTGTRAAIVVFLITLMIMGIGYAFIRHHQDASDSKLSATQQQLAQNQRQQQEDNEVAQKLANQLKQNGIKPTATPSTISSPVAGPSGATGATGPGPSNEQVANAVASYCQANNNCTPPDVTQAQVAAAVASYCSANGQCQGPTGTSGASGAPGATGAQGPGPTDAQVAAAVSAYCSTNGCTGPAGPSGAAGTNGANAPTITAVSEDLGACTITLTMSDSTTVTGAIHGTLTCP